MKSSNQQVLSSNKSYQNGQQKQSTANTNQISEFQKYESTQDEKGTHSSQHSSNLHSVKLSINQFNHNGGQDIEPFKGIGVSHNKQKGEDGEIKEKKSSSQKDLHSSSQDQINERKSSINHLESASKSEKQIHSNKHHSSQIHRLSIEQRQQFANFRMKRDLWIRDLQEVFNKIYENFVNTLKTIKENQTVRRTKSEKLKFRKHLRNQMKEIMKISSSLSDRNDEFINLHDNLPISQYYKNNIMEMHKLLSILLKLQMDNKQLDKIKTQKRYDNKCSEPLMKEIKRSYRRVQRLKAGNRLGQVISDQLEEPDIAAVIAEDQKKKDSVIEPASSKIVTKQVIISVEIPTSNQQINQQSSSKIKDNTQSERNVQHSPQKSQRTGHKNYNSKQEIIEFKTQESEEDYDPYSIEQDVDPKYLDENNNIDVDFAIKEFNKKKQDLQQLVQRFVENVDKEDFNFNDKYINFKDYFAKRYELMGMYLGDNKLNKFLEENENNARQPQQNNFGDYFDDDLQTLYKDLDPSNFQVDDKNIEALQRIIKINEEIRKNLIEEEHANKVKVLDQMNVEQNQQFWTSVFEKRSAANLGNNTQSSLSKSNGQMKSSRSAVTLQNRVQQSIESDQQRDQNQTQLNKYNIQLKEDPVKTQKELKKQQLKFYHDYIHRNVNYNAHPSNPNLKPVLTGKYDTDKIKFIKVSENQPTNIVSSLSTVEKDSHLKKQSIINKIPYQNIKNGEEFQKTFYHSTFYSSGSLPPSKGTLNDIQIKYPQSDKDSQNQFIIPKFRGKKLTYEEEMKLISKQTRKDNPLYLNKFNARNYLTRVAPLSQKSIRQPNIQFQSQMSKTNKDFNKSQLKLNTLLKESDLKEAGISISNPLNSISRKIQQPFSLDIPIQITQENKPNKTISFKDIEQNKIEDTRQNFFTKPKEYFKDEISSVFRVSQRDLLYKINGPSWKNQQTNS